MFKSDDICARRTEFYFNSVSVDRELGGADTVLVRVMTPICGVRYNWDGRDQQASNDKTEEPGAVQCVLHHEPFCDWLAAF